MPPKLRELIIHPDAFFAWVSQEKISLVPPLAIVGAAILIRITGTVLFFGFLQHAQVSGIFYTKISEGTVSSLISYAISLFLIWGIVSFYLYGVSRVFAGTGTFIATVQNAGYGMIPHTIAATGSVIHVGILYYNYHAFLAPQIQMQGYTFFVIQIVSMSVVFFWTCGLWILAVRHTHRFTIRRSALIIGIPAAIWLGITMLPVLENFPMLWNPLTGGL